MSERLGLIIKEIEDYIAGSRKYMFSKQYIIVNKNDIEESLAELRLKTPDEMRKYQKIIRNRDSIINEAEQKATEIIEDAKRKADVVRKI